MWGGIRARKTLIGSVEYERKKKEITSGTSREQLADRNYNRQIENHLRETYLISLESLKGPSITGKMGYAIIAGRAIQ